MVGELGHGTVGRRGYSALGAVVAATKPQDTAALRTIMPEQVFLVPGFGAQGGTVDDVLPCFRSDGTGAIVTASRSVIYGFEPADRDWAGAVARAAGALAEALGSAVGLR
jgi:orotidine-5'-phosphate decarboxylase